MAHPRIIVGIGEALFDIFPDEQRLGGAPLNFALHAHQLGNRGIIVTRIGQDALGQLILDELARRQMPTDHVQSDPDLPTGSVLVSFNADGEPAYDITPHVAWDNLQWDGDLDHLASQCDALCFGTLAQRSAPTRNNIYRFVEAARRAIRLLDLNLRADQPERRQIEHSLTIATALKVNEHELAELARLFDLSPEPDAAAAMLISRFKLAWVALTRGPQGTSVYTAAAKHIGTPVPATPGGNAVGAGDASAAALLHGALRRWDWPRTLTLANTLGAFVASQPGACPELPDAIRTLAQ